MANDNGDVIVIRFDVDILADICVFVLKLFSAFDYIASASSIDGWNYAPVSHFACLF